MDDPPDIGEVNFRVVMPEDPELPPYLEVVQGGATPDENPTENPTA